jgi:Bacterial SH3 domain
MTTERSFPTHLGNWARAHPRLLGASVIVAALALAGVAVIIATTLFSSVPLAGEADPTPSPSAAASQSASAEPSATVAPAASAEPTPVPGPEWPPVADTSIDYLLPPMWAVSVVDDLNVRSGPGTEHVAIAQLDAGDLAKVLDINEPGWVYVAVDGAIGYVNAGPEGDRYLVATKTPWEATATSVEGVASDGESYLAFGHQTAADYPPYEMHGVPSLALRSEDGITWRALEDGPEWSVLAVDASESGWVAIVGVPFGGTLTSYSPDGVTWEEPVGFAEGLTAVSHGPAGWVAIGNGQSWTSTDGRSWTGPHTVVPAETQSPREIESSDAGYAAFDRVTGGLFTSVDGTHWADVTQSGMRVSDVELVDDQLLVVVADEESGATTIRRGALGGNGVAWAGSAQSLGAGLHVDRITQSPGGQLAIGWDETDLVPVSWKSADGATWVRVDAGLGALDSVGLFEPEWGPAGWVGPGLQHSTDGEAWLAPEYTLAYDGPVPPCPPAENVSLIVLAYLGRYAEGCFGDSSITIHAYVPVADGFGGCCPPQGEPDWLAGTFPGVLLAAGMESGEFGSYQLTVRVPPDVDRAPLRASEVGRWVEIVGHYRDPASASCVSRPANFPNPLASHESMQALCRERFVVESVIEVEGP